MTGFKAADLKRDSFLGGQVHLLQPKKGYRAGIDPVLLAASVPARPGQSVLELGCGAGAALYSLAIRCPGLRLFGVELQPEYADLAVQNAELNGLTAAITVADLSQLPADLRQIQFDHIIANPPYFVREAHSPARNPGRRIALGEGETALSDWVDVAARRLSPRGYLHVIQRMDRLPELLIACDGRVGSVEILPLAPRRNRAAELFLMRARKDGRSPFRLHAPCILHQGDRHVRDGDSYAPHIADVLTNGAALDWPDP